MKVKIKRLSDKSVIPTYAKEGDAGLDLVATSKTYDEKGNVVYGTDLAFEIPKGYVGLLFPRSSNSKKDLLNTNSVGVIDSGYRGEVFMKYKHTIKVVDFINTLRCWFKMQTKNNIDVFNIGHEYNLGDRIGQLIILPYPTIEFEEVDELTETERGSGGYGSTGN